MSDTYLVVGGNTGIANQLIQQLTAAGSEVHAALRSPDDLKLDVASKQAFDAENPNEIDLPDSLDGLIYCPGTIQLKPFHRLEKEDYLKDMQVNLFGAVEVLKQAMKPLKKSGNGSVVLFSTVAVATGMPFHASIAAAKGALEGFARSIAAEWAPTIRVNVIAPSLQDTPLAGQLLGNEAKRSAAEERHPLRQVGDPAETAALAKFLVSKDSGFMTGQVLRPDGGLSSLRLF